MSRGWSLIVCGAALLVVSCSKPERSAEEEAEWADIEAIGDTAAAVPAARGQEEEIVVGEAVPDEEFAPYVRALERMKSVRRGEGETLLTSETLAFDYEGGFVRMDRGVVVEDDQGALETESLIGRFSVADRFVVERIEMKGGVAAASGERTARAEEAIYDLVRSFAWLSGGATLSESTNSISGDDVRIWFSEENELKRATAEGAVSIRYGEVLATGASAFYDAARDRARLEGRGVITFRGNRIAAERFEFRTAEGNREMICEPNVVMEGSADAFAVDGVPSSTNGLTEIRGNRLVYDERARTVELIGAARVRDPRATMTCEEIRLNLKEDHEIDWIEARDEVIIQSDDRRALAERATYHANEGLFTLEGEPKVKQGPHVMTGDRIKVWLEPRRMVCEPNARVLLRLDAETKAKFLKDLNE